MSPTQAEMKAAEAAEDRKEAAAEQKKEDAAEVRAAIAAKEKALTASKAKPRFTPYVPFKDITPANIPPRRVPPSTWGVGIWDWRTSKEVPPTGYPCFKDHEGQWWWATTTQQNGVNPGVEKTTQPMGWRPL